MKGIFNTEGAESTEKKSRKRGKRYGPMADLGEIEERFVTP